MQSENLEISDQEVIDWCNSQAPLMIELFNLFAANVINLKIKHDENTGVLSCNGVTLEPHIKRIEKLVGFDEVPSFQLTDWKVHPSSRFHPEEIEDKPVSVHTNPIDAIHALVKFVLIIDVDQWFLAQYPEPDFSDIEDWM
jgi:hypothetical protein